MYKLIQTVNICYLATKSMYCGTKEKIQQHVKYMLQYPFMLHIVTPLKIKRKENRCKARILVGWGTVREKVEGIFVVRGWEYMGKVRCLVLHIKTGNSPSKNHAPTYLSWHTQNSHVPEKKIQNHFHALINI